MMKKYSQMTICKHRGSHCKSDNSNDRGIEKWCPGMLQKALPNVGKSVSLPKGTILMEMLCKQMQGYLFLQNKPILGTF
jgi:hypothetical protein